MASIPLELKALIIDELAQATPCDEKTLSAISYVWPETIPYIRDHRFKKLDLRRSDSISRFLAVMAGAPAISSAIRSISESMFPPAAFDLPPLEMRSQYKNLMNLVMNAPNLEEVSLKNAHLSELNNVLAAIPSSSYSLIKLKKFTAESSYVSSLTVLLNILRSFPHLTTLTLFHVMIMQLLPIAEKIWVTNVNTHVLSERCATWDTHNFKAPKQLPQVTSLCIHISEVSHLMLLDLLASPKTPFPNLEEIMFADIYIPCRTWRLQALLKRYKTTLRVLDLMDPEFNNTTAILALPPTMEHFKFSVDTRTSLKNFCETLRLASSRLRNVTINFQHGVEDDPVPDTEALDKVLVGMPGLKQLDLKVFLQMKETIEDRFPRCFGKQTEGQLRIVCEDRLAYLGFGRLCSRHA